MKKTINLYLLLFVLGLFAFSAEAQQNTSDFSLVEAQQYAMENSYVLHNSRQDVASAQKEVWKTITIGLPQISGSANYNKFLNLPVSLIPAEFFGGEAGTYRAVKFGQDYNSDFGFTLNQLIFDGSYIVGIGSTQIYLNLAKQTSEKTEIDIRDAVAQAYYMVLTGVENRKVMTENLENVKEMYNETKAYYENGFREEQDVDQMRLMVKNAENELVKADREIKIAKVVLKYTMGFDLSQDIVLSDSLKQFVTPLMAVNKSVGFDFSNHIDYRLAQSNFMISEKLLKLEKVAYLPRLSGFYSYTKTAYGNNANLFKSGISWYPSSLVGLQFTVPLFNSGQKMFSVQQAKIEVDKAETQRKLAEITLQKDYLTAVAEMESALEKFENDKENRELAEKILNKSKIKFQNGISSSSELSQMETQYIQSHGAYIGSTLQLLQADLKLKKAKGNL